MATERKMTADTVAVPRKLLKDASNIIHHKLIYHARDYSPAYVGRLRNIAESIDALLREDE